MQGPDLVNSLLSVLLRFRKNAITLVADIEAMFYQVRVDPKDKDSLGSCSGLTGDFSEEPTTHRMNVTWSAQRYHGVAPRFLFAKQLLISILLLIRAM